MNAEYTEHVWQEYHHNGCEPIHRREEIVRCWDCASYRDGVNGCVEFGDESRGEYAIVEPNGFCAWGERRTVTHGSK